jgi:hypothetical protein
MPKSKHSSSDDLDLPHLIERNRHKIGVIRDRLERGFCTQGKRKGLRFTTSARIGLERELAQRGEWIRQAVRALGESSTEKSKRQGNVSEELRDL